MSSNELFIESCAEGNLEEAKKLYKDTYDIDWAFRLSCEYGHFEVSQLLHSLGAPVNGHGYNDYAFRRSCERGHINIAKWLLSLGANIHAKDDEAFLWSCLDGHLEVVKWLYSLGAPVNGHDWNDEAFRLSCMGGHLNIAKWLYSMGANVHTGNDGAFQWSCVNGCIEVTKWFLDINPCFSKRLKSWKIVDVEYNIGEIISTVSHHGNSNVINHIVSKIDSVMITPTNKNSYDTWKGIC